MKEVAVENHLYDEASWCEFFETNKYTIQTICRRYVNHPEIAEDLTQEVFIRFYRNLRKIRGSAISYLKVIAANISIDFLRKKKGRKEVSIGDEDSWNSYFIEDDLSFLTVAKKEVAEKVRNAFRILDEYCITVYWYCAQGFKLHEVAERLKVTEAKVRSDSARCRRKALYCLCKFVLSTGVFTQNEATFIYTFYKDTYASKESAMKSMNLSVDEFASININVLKKLVKFYSSE